MLALVIFLALMAITASASALVSAMERRRTRRFLKFAAMLAAEAQHR